jgi:hypothetical protein
MLSTARAASLLEKQNVNLFRRRSSDFFDDYDHPAINEHTHADGCDNSSDDGDNDTEGSAASATTPRTGPGSARTLQQSRDALEVQPLQLSPPDERGIGCEPPGDAATPVAVASTTSSAAHGTRVTAESPEPPETIEVSSDESDGDGGKWTPSKPIKAIGTVQVHEDDFASLEPGCWLTGQVINAFLHMLNELKPPAARCRVHSFSTFFYPKYATPCLPDVRLWLS